MLLTITNHDGYFFADNDMVSIERDHTDVGQRIENTRSNCVIYEKKKQIIIFKENGKLDALIIRLNLRSLLMKRKTRTS